MNILITGKNGYLSNSLSEYFNKRDATLNIDRVSVRNKLPENLSYYDVVIHTAGLAHKNEKKFSFEDYLEINTLLTEKLAKLAKNSGVKQFIFISTMSVYGLEGTLKTKTIINSKTNTNPINFYGKSKLLAEEKINLLMSENFQISIVRPPMIYGENCTGNYRLLKSFAEKTFIFPFVENERSMLQIDNFCEILYLITINQTGGYFFPQDKDYICTSNLVKKIAKEKNKIVYLSKSMGTLIKFLNITLINKIFGNLAYDKNLSKHFNMKYIVK